MATGKEFLGMVGFYLDKLNISSVYRSKDTENNNNNPYRLSRGFDLPFSSIRYVHLNQKATTLTISFGTTKDIHLRFRPRNMVMINSILEQLSLDTKQSPKSFDLIKAQELASFIVGPVELDQLMAKLTGNDEALIDNTTNKTLISSERKQTVDLHRVQR